MNIASSAEHNATDKLADVEAQSGLDTNKKRRGSCLSVLKSSLLQDALAALACLILALVLELASPRSTYVLKETLYWHSFPHKPNTVPSWSVPLYSLIGPAALFLAYRLVPRRTWREVAFLIVGLSLAYFLTGAITNCLKLPVGRLRPNFVRVCWPNGTQVYTHSDEWGGYAVCDPSVDPGEVEEVRKSWPSGHSSLSAAGLGYTTFFLMGQLQPFASLPLAGVSLSVEGRLWRFLVACLPGFGAIAVAITRVLDYWHFPSDVLTGLAIGFLTAFFVYRLHWPPFTHAHCNRPWEVLLAAERAQRQQQQGQLGQGDGSTSFRDR